jgi:hypothetical protein
MPDFWRQLYPRIYATPSKCGQYCFAKEPANMFLSFLHNAGVDKRDFQDGPELSALMTAGVLMDHSMPMTWIGDQIARAVQQTTSPISINWTTMALPFPALTLMLPGGTLAHRQQGDVLFISYCRVLGDHQNSFVLIRMGRGITTMMSFTGDTQPVVPLGDVNRFHEEFAGLSRAEPSGLENDVRDKTSMHMEFDQPRGHDDDNLSKEALPLLFGVLLVMEARPLLITEPCLINRVQHKQEASKEFWTPRIRGVYYKVKHEAAEPGGGHHSSPRLHWVMGHWRDQPRAGPRASAHGLDRPSYPRRGLTR